MIWCEETAVKSDVN
jgi:hypothetical protein